MMLDSAFEPDLSRTPLCKPRQFRNRSGTGRDSRSIGMHLEQRSYANRSSFIVQRAAATSVADGSQPVTISVFLTLLPLLIGLGGAAASAEEPRVRSFVVQDELILRVPVQPTQRNIEWAEYDGPQCINAKAIRGAFLSGADSVDFITVRHRRIRAELAEDCPGLDFYDGFYLKPEDARICVKRDVIRSRSGGSCPIQRFKVLVPKARR